MMKMGINFMLFSFKINMLRLLGNKSKSDKNLSELSGDKK